MGTTPEHVPGSDKPRIKTQDYSARVRAADGKKPFYYPIYRFTRKTFFERDKKGPSPS